MNPDIIQFQCSACQSVLTVPANLAGVSGPCPTCGQTVTSPAATPSFSGQGFGSSQYGSAEVPAPQQQEARPSRAMPVQPMPGSLGGPMQAPANSGLIGGSVFPSAPQSQAAPSWQAPGLGQTLMSGNLPPQSGFLQPSLGSPSLSGSLLPPQRMEGQTPMTGSLPQTPANPMAWGAGINPAAPSGMPQASLGLPQRNPGQSSLIPGSTSPTMGGFAEPSDRGSLMGQAIPSAPLPSAPPEFHRESATPPLNVPASSGVRARALKKPKRSTNVFMVGLAVLLLGGFLAAAGWLFRAPILQLVNRFMPQSSDVSVTPKSGDVPTTTAPVVDIVPTEPKMAESTTLSETTAFDPSEVAAVSLKATPATTEEISKAVAPEAQSPMAVETTASALTTATKSGALMEVPSTDTNKLKQASSDSSKMPSGEQMGVKIDVPPEAKPAVEALQKFLAAETLEERLKYTLAADSMRPLMERYYGTNSNGPILVDAIGLVRFDPKPQMGAGAHALIGLESKTWEFPIIVMLEERQGSFKVDWLSFVEFKDRLLEKYLQTFQEGQVRYHVGLTRTHYFEDKVPNSSNKEAFKLSTAPPNPFSATVFMDKDSALARDLRDKIPWGAQVFAIVELEWMKLGNQAWVQMSAVPQLNWYSVPSAPKAVKANSSSIRADESSEVPTETQKAVPIGR